MNLIIKKYENNMIKIWDDFVNNLSINGTIYHTQLFLSYHKNKFEDSSILIYEKNKLIAVFPCCKDGINYYSHKGSTCGGIVILEKYYKLNKLINIMEKIYDYYNSNLYIKLSEDIYFRKNYSNDLLNFVLSQKCSISSDIVLYYKVNNEIKFNKRNRNYINKYKKNSNINSFISDSDEDYINFYNILKKYLVDKNNTLPIHTLKEFLELKKIINDKQFLFLNKDKKNNILSGAWVLEINNNTFYTPYLTTNYEFKNANLLFLLYDLYNYTLKQKNYYILNLGSSSKNGGKEILTSNYNFKTSSGCSSTLKYNFVFKKKKEIKSDRISLKSMEIYEQYLITKMWNDNEYARKMFFFKDNIFNYENQLKWYENISKSNETEVFSIFHKINKNFIGYCGIKNITEKDCELFIVILDKNYYNLGLGKETFNLLINYSKKAYDNIQLYLNVKKENEKAIRLYKDLNFKIMKENNNIYTMKYIY